MKRFFLITIIASLPILVCIFMMYAMYSGNVKSILAWFIIISSALVFVATYLSFFFYIGRSQTIDQINKYKERLSYDSMAFTIHLYNSTIIVEWETIESIFLKSILPGDGTYHTQEYKIRLTRPPFQTKDRKQRWYNKISFHFGTNKSIVIRIENYNNLSFNTFYRAIQEHLIKQNADLKNIEYNSDDKELIYFKKTDSLLN